MLNKKFVKIMSSSANFYGLVQLCTSVNKYLFISSTIPKCTRVLPHLEKELKVVKKSNKV